MLADALCRGEVWRLGIRLRRRHLEQPFLVTAIGGEIRKRIDGVFRREEVRDAARVQSDLHVLPIDRAEPCAQHRFVGAARDGGDGMRRLQCADDRARHVQHQDRIRVGVRQRGRDRGGEPGGRRVAAHVDGVLAGDLRRQQRVQRRNGGWRQLRERNALGRSAIGGKDAGTAAVGYDDEPLAARNLAQRENARRGEELRIGSHTHRAGARKCRVEHHVGHDRRSQRVGEGALARTPRLENDYGFGARRGAQRRDERARIAHAFDVEQDAVGRRIVDQRVEQFAEADIDAAA